jgi:hypothetical protein
VLALPAVLTALSTLTSLLPAGLLRVPGTGLTRALLALASVAVLRSSLIALALIALALFARVLIALIALIALSNVVVGHERLL